MKIRAFVLIIILAIALMSFLPLISIPVYADTHPVVENSITGGCIENACINTFPGQTTFNMTVKTNSSNSEIVVMVSEIDTLGTVCIGANPVSDNASHSYSLQVTNIFAANSIGDWVYWATGVGIGTFIVHVIKPVDTACSGAASLAQFNTSAIAVSFAVISASSTGTGLAGNPSVTNYTIATNTVTLENIAETGSFALSQTSNPAFTSLGETCCAGTEPLSLIAYWYNTGAALNSGLTGSLGGSTHWVMIGFTLGPGTITTTSTITGFVVPNFVNGLNNFSWLYFLITVIAPIGEVIGMITLERSAILDRHAIIFIFLSMLLLDSIFGVMMNEVTIAMPFLFGILFGLYLWRGRG